MEESIIEVWKNIKDYEGLYQVSDLGRVKRISTNAKYGQGNYYREERIISVNDRGNGYLRCHLSKNGKTKNHNVHRLVAMAFIENSNKFSTVNHIDENKQNNCVSNLEWCNMSYQNRYGNGAKNRNEAKKVKVIQMDMNGKYIEQWDSIQEASNALKLNPSSVVCVCKNKRRYKSTGGFKFKYAEEGI